MTRFFWPLVIVCIGIAIMYDCVDNFREDAAFEERAETARIQPVGDYEVYAHYKRGRRQPGNLMRDKVLVGVSHAAELTFVTKKGEVITLEKQGLPPGYVDASRSNKPLLLWYLPEEPTRVRLSDDKRGNNYEMLFGIAFLALGLVKAWGAMAGQPRRVAVRYR
jgi:hypothetical protein